MAKNGTSDPTTWGLAVLAAGGEASGGFLADGSAIDLG